MKFYNSIGPNPHIVRMFAAEKGITLDSIDVDLMKGANREAAHMARNPAGQTPALETDDGQFICEITAICEYLEELHPSPALIGTTPGERAETRMWVRRFDENVAWPLLSGFRYAEGAPMFSSRIPVFTEIAPQLKSLAQNREKWFDGMISGRTYFCGDRFTLADILAFGMLAFGQAVGQQINPEATNLIGWFDRVKARASAAA